LPIWSSGPDVGAMFPVTFDTPSESVSIEEWVRQNRVAINKSLKQTGAVLLRGLAMQDPDHFEKFVVAYGLPVFPYRESLSNAVRVNHSERVFTANEAPSQVEIYLHHEMAQTPVSPSVLFFCCISAAEQGGATPLCRSDQLFEAFKLSHPKWTEQLVSKGLRYVTRMPAVSDESSGQGRSWYNTLNVSDKDEVEKKLTAMGYEYSWQNNGGLETLSPLLPGVVELTNGGQSFYHQLIAAYRGWPGVRENPASGVIFGDKTEIPVGLLESLSTMAEDYTTDLHWADGEIAMLNNRMIMHGRRPYSGNRKRQVLVSMAP
jgi:hypothetical protein